MSDVEKRQGRNEGYEKKDNVAFCFFSQLSEFISGATPFSPIQTVSGERVSKVNHSLNCFARSSGHRNAK